MEKQAKQRILAEEEELLTSEQVRLAAEISGGSKMFKDVIETITGHKVIAYDMSDHNCRTIDKYLKEANRQILYKSAVTTKRVNESSNGLEEPYSEILRGLGLIVEKPLGRNSGYPDRLVIVPLVEYPVYLEIKTTGDLNKPSNFRAFYMSGMIDKVTRSAHHVCVAFEVEERYVTDSQSSLFQTSNQFVPEYKKYKRFVPVSAKVIDMSKKRMTLKSEWNCTGNELLR